MYAIVEIAGQQFKVEKDQQIYIHRLEDKEGTTVQFDDVLLIDNDGKVNVGTPAIEGAAVKAKVLQHLKSDKVIVFKKKRRKGYQKKNGHRQYMSQVQIEEILEKGAKKITAKKEEKEATAKASPKPKKEEKPTAAAKTKAKTEEKPKKETTKKAETKAKPAAKAEAGKEAKKETKKEAPKATTAKKTEASEKKSTKAAKSEETPKKADAPKENKENKEE